MKSRRKKISRLQCSDQNLETALTLSKILLEHSLFVLTIIGKTGYKGLSNIPKKFFNALPDKFTRKKADAIVKELKINYKTAEKYIGDMVKKNLIERVQHGEYREKQLANKF